MKRISIITINRNNAAGLRKTLSSVAAQTSEGYEQIVIDGASTDGSADVIREYGRQISYWVSEPDSGVYNAMNKGISAAKGEYCMFINSGDWLFDEGVVGKLLSAIWTGKDIYYADLRDAGGSGEGIRFPDKVGLGYFLSGNINHQNSLIRRDCLLRHGMYNELNAIKSDWEFFLKASRDERTTFEHVSFPIALYIHEGISADPRNKEKWLGEMHRAYVNEFGSELGGVLWEYFQYRCSVYHDILGLGGNTRPLDFMLKSYRYIARRIRRR